MFNANRLIQLATDSAKTRDSGIVKLIFGSKVAHLRQQRGLSYQELGHLTGLSAPYLHEIEKGKKYPKADKIMALAKAFEVPYDELVSVYTSKKLQPIIELLESDWFNSFPLEEMFGINAAKLMELFSNTPDKVNAFIGTVIKIARNYQLQTESFFNSALRTYQDLHDNYFEEIELAVSRFVAVAALPNHFPLSTDVLQSALYQKFGIVIDRVSLPQSPKLRGIRSVYSPIKQTLYLNPTLSNAQQNFLIGRELGFQYLQLSERPFETIVQRVDTFEKLLNNFKASYFASALLMPEPEIIRDIHRIAQLPVWNNQVLFDLLARYQVTPEMLLQRLTNIFPKHFEIKDLFFLRTVGSNDLSMFVMDKDLHLSRYHSPYANQLNEHFCRRWASIRVLKRLRTQTEEQDPILAESQISEYWETDNAYFILSMGKRQASAEGRMVSVTLGLMITDRLRSLFPFLNDSRQHGEHLPTFKVNTTCERCSMPDCAERAAPPVYIERRKGQEAVAQELKLLIG